MARPRLILLMAACLTLVPMAASGAAPLAREAGPLAQNRDFRRNGNQVVVNGLVQRAEWLWLGGSEAAPAELWLPLEVLQGQLGISSRTTADGSLDLEWFGQGLIVPTAAQRSLADEVAVNAAELLARTGTRATLRGDLLSLELPPPQLLQVRTSSQPGVRRVVFDLSAPAVVRNSEQAVIVGLRSGANQLAQLNRLGLGGRQGAEGLTLTGPTPTRVFTLGNPPRIVIDLPAPAAIPGTASAPGSGDVPVVKPAAMDPRLLALLGRDIQWDRQLRQVGNRRTRVNAVRIDPRSSSLELRTLSNPGGMEGIGSLLQLANQNAALVAINGGYFNRVRRLPLGALKTDGRWLSGPILGRGVVAWEPGDLPTFGRLRLDEWLVDGSGRSWPMVVLNSGFVQRGLSRYTSDWGPVYRALSGAETAFLLRDGRVAELYDSRQLELGVPLRGSDSLIVSRAGAGLPWQSGDPLTLQSRTNMNLGTASHVMGGGPLLLLDGRTVLNGVAEGFQESFMRQGAPRTVIGSDGRQVWLITIEGVEQDPGPTLAETATLLQQMGLRDALNLDGGSSTGLIMGGNHTVKGRGVAGSVHNGLGLVPSRRQRAQAVGMGPGTGIVSPLPH